MLKRIRPAVIAYLFLLCGVGYSIYRVEENVSSAAHSRVTTVSQRCELTNIVLSEAKTDVNKIKLSSSLAGCYKQLKKVKAEAGR